MRGDFSHWRDESRRNFNGVLHQQGRVMHEADLNAQLLLQTGWQDLAARDTIGPRFVAVPAEQPDGFKVKRAAFVAPDAEITLGTGRAWLNGWLTQLFGEKKNNTGTKRVAAYLQPPLQNPVPSEPVDGGRDAVILELWREELNAFQLPDVLLEPALGGVDTTERLHTAMAFKLRRLAPGEDCESILPSLQDNFAAKGRLTVTLDPDTALDGDCPVVFGGGYTGFEHNLYRVEIAQVKAGLAAHFKWSQYNGGLVGRGIFDNVNKKVQITHNQAAILHSGLNEFYLEAVHYDEKRGHWRVVYAAKATLDGNGALKLPAAGSADEFYGLIPIPPPAPQDQTIFFRLWNGVQPIADFTAAAPLQDGLNFKFDADAPGKYTPGDYWTCEVRAGEIPNNQIELIAGVPTLINNQPPRGIHYFRAPLGVVTWNNLNPSASVTDCRVIFRPLTQLSTCCTFRVGDGLHSFGDFDTIQAAVEHLPDTGGEICVLPGVYKENVWLKGLSNIVIKGCGPRSRIEAPANDPALHLLDCRNVTVSNLAVNAHREGISVLVGLPLEDDGGEEYYSQNITLEHLHVRTASRCGIAARDCAFVTVRECRVAIQDTRSEFAAIYLAGDDSLLENNVVQVLTDDNDFNTPLIPDPVLDPGQYKRAGSARGGIHLSGGCDRVRVVNNLVNGGIGDGITLGSVDEIDEQGRVIVVHFPWWPGGNHDRGDYNPRPVRIDIKITIGGGVRRVAGAPLHDILIQGNRLYNMGRNGIGVDGFFDLSKADELISVENLTITGNDIRFCLNRPIPNIPPNLLNAAGFGGIALADAENLVIQDNFITDNGPNHLEPVCGVFVLHGAGVDISHNRIVNNGARTRENAEAAENGPRGGIVVLFGVAPQVEGIAPNDPRGRGFSVPLSNGIPALKIHDNVVSAPLGQALFLVALGPVSVVGNQFTSLGVVPRRNAPGLVAATVLIFNLGLSNELYFQALSFQHVRKGGIYAHGGADDDPAQPGLDDFKLGRYLANGNVLFAHNQCVLNLLERGPSRALASVLILTLDDLGFHGNQCDCDLLDDLILTHAFLFGVSLRVCDNRFKEGLRNAALSAATYGWLNATTDNEATHCLHVRGRLFLDKHNLVLLDSFFYGGPVEAMKQSICRRLQRVQGTFANNDKLNARQAIKR